MQIKMDSIDTQFIAEAVVNLLIPSLKNLLESMIANGAVVAAPHSSISVSDEDMLEQAQVAKMIGMSTAWLEKKRCVGGGIPFRKMGSSVRYRRDDVNDYINRRKFGNTCEAAFDQLSEDNNDDNQLKP